MKTKEEIVSNWLPRYTGEKLENFGSYILLTNFSHYVHLFAEMHKVEIIGEDKPMQCATQVKSASLILVWEVLPRPPSWTCSVPFLPKLLCFLGKCGGLKKRNKLGDLVLPIAAIRGEGTSNDYFPPEVPALPAFALQKAISTTIREFGVDYWTGTVYTTNRRVWEHDEVFKEYLKKIRAYAIDMETATIFSVGFYNKIPTGALLLVSDQPMIPDGVKTAESDQRVTGDFVETHLKIGIDSLKQLINGGLTVRHLRF